MGDEKFVLIGRTQVCVASDGREQCAEPGEVCQAVMLLTKFSRWDGVIDSV